MDDSTNTEEQKEIQEARWAVLKMYRHVKSIHGWITFIGILIIIGLAVQLLDSCAAAF